MKRIAFWMVALLLMSGVAMAQNENKGKRVEPKVRAERMTNRMVKDLSLNDKQKKELLEANTTWVEQMESFREAAQSNKEGEDTSKKSKKQRKEMKEARDAYEAKLSKILTKEQYESYQKQQAEHQQKMKENRKNKSEE